MGALVFNGISGMYGKTDRGKVTYPLLHGRDASLFYPQR